MKQDGQKRTHSIQPLISPQKSNSFFPLEFDFYNKGKIEQLKIKTSLGDFAKCGFITGIRILGEETGYFILGVDHSNATEFEESMYTELGNILAGKFVNLICEQTTAYLSLGTPQSIRSMSVEKKLMLEFLENADGATSLICPYVLRLRPVGNIKIFAAFLPTRSNMRFEN